MYRDRLGSRFNVHHFRRRRGLLTCSGLLNHVVTGWRFLLLRKVAAFPRQSRLRPQMLGARGYAATPPLLSPAFAPLKSTFRDFKEDFEPETVPLCHISINKKN